MEFVGFFLVIYLIIYNLGGLIFFGGIGVIVSTGHSLTSPDFAHLMMSLVHRIKWTELQSFDPQ